MTRHDAQPAPTLRPKDAATLIVLRRDGGDTRVLMGRRSERHAFMPGAVVFPGGRELSGDDPIPFYFARRGALVEDRL